MYFQKSYLMQTDKTKIIIQIFVVIDLMCILRRY